MALTLAALHSGERRQLGHLYSLWRWDGVSQVVLVVKNLPANAGNIRDTGSIPELGRSLEKEMATHSSILARRIPVERGAWRATVYGVTKSQT